MENQEIEGNDNRISLTEWKNGYRISIADRKMPEVIKPVDKPKKDDINAVKTGDGEMPLFYGIMAILSIGAAGVVGVIRRRKRR